MLWVMRRAALFALSMGILAVSAAAREAQAQTTDTAMRRAGAAFDDGVARFKRADYAGAAKALRGLITAHLEQFSVRRHWLNNPPLTLAFLIEPSRVAWAN